MSQVSNHAAFYEISNKIKCNGLIYTDIFYKTLNTTIMNSYNFIIDEEKDAVLYKILSNQMKNINKVDTKFKSIYINNVGHNNEARIVTRAIPEILDTKTADLIIFQYKLNTLKIIYELNVTPTTLSIETINDNDINKIWIYNNEILPIVNLEIILVKLRNGDAKITKDTYFQLEEEFNEYINFRQLTINDKKKNEIPRNKCDYSDLEPFSNLGSDLRKI